jgi:hypothetical protein
MSSVPLLGKDQVGLPPASFSGPEQVPTDAKIAVVAKRTFFGLRREIAKTYLRSDKNLFRNWTVFGCIPFFIKFLPRMFCVLFSISKDAMELAMQKGDLHQINQMQAQGVRLSEHPLVIYDVLYNCIYGNEQATGNSLIVLNKLVVDQKTPIHLVFGDDNEPTELCNLLMDAAERESHKERSMKVLEIIARAQNQPLSHIFPYLQQIFLEEELLRLQAV